MSKTVKPSWSFPVISAFSADITPAMEKSLSHLELNLGSSTNSVGESNVTPN